MGRTLKVQENSTSTPKNKLDRVGVLVTVPILIAICSCGQNFFNFQQFYSIINTDDE